MKNKIALAVVALPLLLCAAASAKVLHVPASHASIQAAINAATHGDTVLVAPGTYFENIIFRGKRIIVGSHYVLNHDVKFIRTTIINGSRPVHPDTTSCVLIINREDSTAVLAGFTLTGGRGTRWLDEHGAGYYWEGGGVLTALSSPTIRDNFIVDNEAINNARAASAGGGAIRSGDGAPRILNNVMLANRAMYGGGLVLNYCSGALVRNNIIAENRVYQAVSGAQTFGGGGIWINVSLPGVRVANRIENNTLIGNSATGNPTGAVSGQGGALVAWNSAIVSARNNIFWGNTQTQGGPIAAAGATFSLSYSAVQGGYAGTGNVALHPAFADSAYYLSLNSPCVDAGDPSTSDNDVEAANASGQAQWPSRGTVRNDMGAYGGPGAHAFWGFSRASLGLAAASYDFGNILPGNSSVLAVPLYNNGATTLRLDDTQLASGTTTITRLTTLPLLLPAAGSDTLRLRWMPTQNGLLLDTLFLVTNDTTKLNSKWLVLRGNANPTPVVTVNTAQFNLGDIDINTPRVDTTFWVYNRGTGADSLYMSIEYRGLKPTSAVSLSPASASIAAGDSLRVRFSIFPRTFAQPLLALYAPSAIVNSRFSPGTKRFEKLMRFRIVGALAVDDHAANSPATFRLEQNYPNPFNPSTKLRFHLPQAQHAQLRIYDELGRTVATLVDGFMPAGSHEVFFSAKRLAVGSYYYVLKAGPHEERKKMIFLP
ncbi:hypothetical protein HUU05_06405 [candidate division KSB1 bacterium]|nr:hypothetical protein [candidate division KSB1 bacterium]